MTGTGRNARREKIATTRKLAYGASGLAIMTAVAVQLMTPSSAHAQQTQQPTSGSTQTQPSNAQAGSAPKSGVETITVTAEYRKENLQKTPISITALTSQTLEVRGITDILGVANAVPNVTMTMGSAGFGNSNQVFIRGIGQNDFSFAFEPRVAFYVDDVYYATVFGSVFDLLDVDRVEVLRGPQGTLFGRNSVGGAIRIFTKKPMGDDTGSLELTGGSYNRFDVKGEFDVPIVEDKLMLRVSGGEKRQDGYIDRINFACANPTLAGTLPNVGVPGRNGCKVGTLGGTDLYDGRAQLRWVINDNIEDNFSIDYTHDNSEAPPDVPVHLQYFDNTFPNVPNTVHNGLYLWLNGIGANYGLTANPAYLSAFIPPSKYQTYAIYGNPGFGANRPGTACTGPVSPAPCPQAQMINPPIDHVRQFGWSNTFDWDLPADIHLKYIAAWREYAGEFGSDVNSVPVPIQEVYNEVSHHQWQQEVQISGDLFAKAIEWTVGAFYLDTYNDNSGRVQTEGFEFFGLPFILDMYADDNSSVNNLSGFGTATWHITSRLNLTLGARYTEEKKNYHYIRAYPYQALGFPLDASAPENKFDQFNPRVAIDYALTPDILLYTSYSTGFTAGGNDPRPFFPADVTLTFGPEKATAYEAGVKSEWFDHKVRLNLDGFLTDFKNIQLFLSNAPTGSPFYYDNGGDARITGFEAEFEMAPTPEWVTTAFAGYTHYEWTRISPQANVTGDPAGLTMNSPPLKSPEWKIGASTQYDFDIGDFGTITPRIDATYTSTVYFGNDRTDPWTRQSPVTLVNARITWRPMNPNWTLAVFVSNLTNKYYWTNTFDESNGFGVATASIAPPREWGVTVRRTF